MRNVTTSKLAGLILVELLLIGSMLIQRRDENPELRQIVCGYERQAHAVWLRQGRVDLEPAMNDC